MTKTAKNVLDDLEAKGWHVTHDASELAKTNQARRKALTDAGKAVIVVDGFDVVTEHEDYFHMVFLTDKGPHVLVARGTLGQIDRLLSDNGIKTSEVHPEATRRSKP